ncbi:MAG TPA: ATP-binding protein [Candidatus Eisenbacteria bacterium]|nr:ATP-binding protein [Candidatus Eisenbacteria bacterium]
MTRSTSTHPETAVELEPASAARELTADELTFHVALDNAFDTTAELTPRENFRGQERALAALELGLGVAGAGYNIFVSGLTGAEKLQMLRQWIASRVATSATPGDWVYVHNFKHPDAPCAIYLRAGQGIKLSERMQNLVKTLRDELPKAFRQEAFNREKQQLREKYTRRAQELNAAFERLAREKGFLLQAGPGGQILFIPLIGGKPLEKPEQFSSLPPAEQEEIGRRQQELAVEMERFGRKQQEVMREMEADVRLVERRFCEELLNPLIHEIEKQMENQEVSAYLADVKEHMLNNLDDFKEGDRPAALTPFAPPSLREREPFIEYQVNVVVDNSETKGAPVLVETSPTYRNLFGTIERVVDRFGRIVANFTRIRSGSFLRAHGGYLIFSLDDAISEPAVWKVLKRTLKSGRIELETYEPFALFSTSGLKPEPVDIQTKVVVAGSSLLYHLLYTWDEEFREVFKVRADFRRVMEREQEHLLAYGEWIAQVCREEKLPDFDRAAVERVIEFGARQAQDRDKILASYADVADLVREAAFWGRKENGQVVSARHVEQAIENRVFRSNRIEEEIRELIANGTILIDIDGKKVGQVNGLSVLDLGGYAFGRPSRVTASVAMGRSGILNIERESRLSGRIHDKGVLILAGYLRNRYGQDKPLAISASICFEQSYSEVEGDSASSAELYTLLSCLSNVPLRQDLAVTGSVNQWGEIQAIGGVNEKVEGFFHVCRFKGLTGKQGVMVPEANLRNLVLRPDVIEAVRRGEFHIYPIRTIDEGIELLTGVRSGRAEEDGTVNGLVNRRLGELAAALKSFDGAGEIGERRQVKDGPG